MIAYEDECVGCPPEIGCLGDTCPYKHVKRIYCDICGDETDTVWEFNDTHYCKRCLLDAFPKHSL